MTSSSVFTTPRLGNSNTRGKTRHSFYHLALTHCYIIIMMIISYLLLYSPTAKRVNALQFTKDLSKIVVADKFGDVYA